MKQRIVKKWINRYIKPVIKDLPTTEYGAFEVEENGMIRVRGSNHTIINGEVVPEGSRHNGCQDLHRNIKLSAQKAQEIIEKYEDVRLRIFDIRGNYVRMRLITE